MPSSYTSSLRLTLPATGELSGTWGSTVNDGVTSLTDSAIAGTATVSMTDADYTLTTANGATDEARRMFIRLTGGLTASRNVICPAVSKLYFVYNNTSGGQNIVFKTSAGSGITVPNGARMVLYCDGTNVVEPITNLTSGITLGGNLVVNGNTTLGDAVGDTITVNGTPTFVNANPTFSAGTANGVAYLNGSKVLTSGTALTFDGSTLATTGALTVNGNVTLGDASTDTVTVNGYMGVGGAGNSIAGLWITNSNLSGTTQEGGRFAPVGTSSATTWIRGVTAAPQTAATAFTASNVASFYAGASVLGAGSTITNSHGVYVADQNGGTNNYGITSLVSSGSNKWNIYANGTANNYFAGNVGIGTSTPDAKLNTYQVNGGGEAPILFQNFSTTTNTTVALYLSPTNGSLTTGGIRAGFIKAINVGGGVTALTFGTNSSGADPTERMRIDSAGNVGIGTSSPVAPLDVTNSVSITNGVYVPDGNKVVFAGAGVTGGVELFRFGRGAYTTSGSTNVTFLFQPSVGDNGYNAGWYCDTYRPTTSIGSGNYFAIGQVIRAVGGTGNPATLTERLRIDSAGNLGLGVTPSAWGSSHKAIEIGFVGSSVFAATNGTGTFLTNSAYYNGTNWIYSRSGAATYYAQGYGQHTWYTAPSGTAGNAITFTQAMTLSAAGGLSIGDATDPGAGGLRVTGNATLGTATTDTVTVNGYMGVGGAGNAAIAALVQNNALSGVVQEGVRSVITSTSGATTAIRGFYSRPTTAAAAFTATDLTGFYAANPTKGAGSTITSQHGLYVEDQTQGTNNYGITSLVSSGSNKWNIYASGTAANYFAGNVGIGTSAPGALLHVNAESGSSAIQTLRTLKVDVSTSIPENSAYQRLKITIGSTRQSAAVRITWSSKSTAGISGMGGGVADVFISRVDGGAVVYPLKIANSLSLSAAISMDAPTVSGNDVIFGFRSGNNGTGTIYNFDISVELVANNTSVFTVAEITGTTASTGASSAGSQTFYTNNTERLRIDSAGNLGLGVTPSAWSGTYKAIELGKVGAALFGNTSNGNINLTSNAYINSSSVWTYAATGPAVYYNMQGSSGQHIWFTAPSGTAGNPITFTQAMTLDASNNLFLYQPAPAAVNATATLTVANLQTRIITSTTAAAVTGTLPTGTLMDGWFSDAANMAVDWTVINTGATNNFTVALGTGHSVVGNMVVLPSASGTFRSRRTAANTWITYRVA